MCSRARGDDAVALTEAAVVVHPELGNDEHAQTLGARRGALRSGEHEVDDVLYGVEIAVGDEGLYALEFVEVAFDLSGLGAARADVTSRIGLGEHHGATPVPLDHVLHVALLLLVRPQRVDHEREESAEQVKGDRGVRAGDHLQGRPAHRRRPPEAAETLGHLEPIPVVVVPGGHRLRQSFGQGHVALPVELRGPPGQRTRSSPPTRFHRCSANPGGPRARCPRPST